MRRELTCAFAAFTATTVALGTEVKTLSTKTADCSFTSSYDKLPTSTTGQVGTSSVNCGLLDIYLISRVLII
ncbi:hypothetical protein CSPX01_16574 [Colletotrichum filicis]|nr:hypothetical protein CSPX01_16574 [Colletotrichum filicis]